MEAAESLAGFAILVSIGSFLLGIIVLIAFFVMTSNIGSIAKNTRNMDYRQSSMQSSLEKIARLMDEKEKSATQTEAAAH